MTPSQERAALEVQAARRQLAESADDLALYTAKHRLGMALKAYERARKERPVFHQRQAG